MTCGQGLVKQEKRQCLPAMNGNGANYYKLRKISLLRMPKPQSSNKTSS